MDVSIKDAAGPFPPHADRAVAGERDFVKVPVTPACVLYPLRMNRSVRGPHDTDILRNIYFLQIHGSLGEANPSARLCESIRETGRALERIRGELEHDLAHPEKDILADMDEAAVRLRARHAMYPSARCAAEMVLHDLAARRRGLALFEMLGLPSPDGVASSFTLRLGTQEEMEWQLEIAQAYAALKINYGYNNRSDLEKIEWLSRRTGQPIRLNVHGNWNLEEAQGILHRLLDMNIEYVQQPLPRHRVSETALLARKSPIPILLEDDAGCALDLDYIAGSCHGFVLRVMRCGGIREALRMIQAGRRLEMKIAMDTSVESSAGVTAAAHLAAAVDYVNLGNLQTIENDPLRGVRLEGGRIELPSEPGLGLSIRQGYLEYFA